MRDAGQTLTDGRRIIEIKNIRHIYVSGCLIVVVGKTVHHAVLLVRNDRA